MSISRMMFIILLICIKEEDEPLHVEEDDILLNVEDLQHIADEFSSMLTQLRRRTNGVTMLRWLIVFKLEMIC